MDTLEFAGFNDTIQAAFVNRKCVRTHVGYAQNLFIDFEPDFELSKPVKQALTMWTSIF